MRPTDRGPTDRGPDRSDIARWVDVARRGAPEEAETRRARMLIASHREAKLESTLMSDFDVVRAPRAGDERLADDAVRAVLQAQMRASGDRLRKPAALGAHSAHEGARVASAIATPGPQQALRIEGKREEERRRRPAIVRGVATLGAGVALGLGIAVVALGGELGSVSEEPAATSAPIAAAGGSSDRDRADDDRDALPIARDRRTESIDAALMVLDAPDGARRSHIATRRLALARRLIERGDLARASRVLRVVSRRWPRRVEASAATLALGHVYVAIERPRLAERAWSRWLRARPHDPGAIEIRARVRALAISRDQ